MTSPGPDPDPPSDDLLDVLQHELTLLSRHYTHTQKTRPERTLELSAYGLLSRLELQAPMSLKELAEAFRLDLSTINRQVAALVRKHLVEYVVDPEGGAARKVQPTRLGLDELGRDRSASCAGLARVLEHWSPEDRDTFCALLTRFNQDIERLEGMPWPRPDR